MPDKTRPPLIFAPKRFGLVFEWVFHNQIRILEGEYCNEIFTIDKEEKDNQFQLHLRHQDCEVGHCFAELGKNEIITIWDVVLEAAYQRKGLSELMVKLLLKELLARQKTTQFQIRMLQLFKPNQAEIKLQNIGMGVIAYKLGLSCEYNFTEFLEKGNINYIEVISTETIGTAYKINLNCFPYTLVAFLMDIEKERVITNYDTYVKFRALNEVLANFAYNRALIIGNADYVLKDEGINDFVNHLADNEKEAKVIYKKIVGVK